MQIWRDVDDVPADLGRTVVSIGNFDGVHLGHAHVLREARASAARLGIDTVVAVTFDPHPMAVLRPEHAPPTLTSIHTRARLLEGAGVDAILVVGFDREIASWSPLEFIDRILVDTLHAGAVVVGSNFRFGAKAAGEVATLVEAGATRDFETVGVPLDGGPQVWSSTYVRQCLATGDVAGAAEALGRPFTVRGTVVEGDKRGREMGYPTANVPIPPVDAAPADGVYAGRLTRLDTGETLPRRDLGRHQPDLRRRAGPSRGVLRPRPRRPRALRRRGRGRLRRPAARDGEVRGHGGPHRDHARRRTPRARDLLA